MEAVRTRVAPLDAEDLEAVIGRIDSEEVLLVRGHREQAHLPTLEERTRRTGLTGAVL